MKKIEYIRTLEKHLRFRLPTKEIREISGDFSEYFDLGAAEGKDENEISAALGSPEAAASEILGEKAYPPSPLWKYVPEAVSVCAAAVCLVIASKINSTAVCYIILLALPLIIWFMCEGRSFLSSMREYKRDIIRLSGAFLTAAAAYAAAFIPCMLLERNEQVRILAYVTAAVFIAGTVLHLIWLKGEVKKPIIVIFIIFGVILSFSAVMCAVNCSDIIINYMGPAYHLQKSGELSKYIITLSLIFTVTFILSGIIKRGAFSLPEIYISLSAALSIIDTQNALMYVDPSDIHSFKYLTPCSGYIITGAVLAVMCICTAKALEKHNAERTVR